MTVNGEGRVTSNAVFSGPSPENAQATAKVQPQKQQEPQPQPKRKTAGFSYPTDTIPLVPRHLDEPRQMRVCVIGAGIAGITAGVLLPAKVPNIKLTIFDKNPDVGGVWYENVYPGVRCDVPAHVYQSSYESNPYWTERFAQGAEIRDHWQMVARKYHVYENAKLSHKVCGMRWDGAKGTWAVETENLKNTDGGDGDGVGKKSTEEFEFVIMAIGRFNSWKLPDYPGMDSFKGLLRHAQNYDPDFDPRGKKVAVIGNGASGIQLVANLQRRGVGHLDHYARNPTWIAATLQGDSATSIDPIPIPADIQATFSDPDKYLKFRKEQTDKYWRRINGWFKDHEENSAAREEYTANFVSKLSSKPDLLEKLLPRDFAPHCRRLTPGPGYLEALVQDNATYINSTILRFTPEGIETADGRTYPADAIFCATGSHLGVPQFPILGVGGKPLVEAWGGGNGGGGGGSITNNNNNNNNKNSDEETIQEEEEAQDQEEEEEKEFFPSTYQGLSVPGFPNLGFLIGPSGAGRAGTGAPYTAEIQVGFFAKLLRKMSREGYKSAQPSQEATDDFLEWSDALFGTTVLSEGCSSWYNGGKVGGRVHGLWPGSAAHMASVLREPRWEDWVWEGLGDGVGDEAGGDDDDEYEDGEGRRNNKKRKTVHSNRFAWYFGRGTLRKEIDLESDMTSYLKVPGEVNLKDLHESWWSIP